MFSMKNKERKQAGLPVPNLSSERFKKREALP